VEESNICLSFIAMGIGTSTLELVEVRAGLMSTGTGHPEASVAVLKSATVQLEKSGTEDSGLCRVSPSLLLLFTCSSQVFARVPTHSPHPPSPIRFTDTEKLRELMIGDVSTNLRVSHTPTAHLCARFVRACTLPSSTPPHKSLAVAVVPLAAAQAPLHLYHPITHPC
jgi:hypothetical protein